MNVHPVAPVTEIGSVLRAARIEQKLTAEALSERIGCAKSCVTLWERGHRHPSAVNLRKWAQALGFDVVVAKKNGVGS